MRLANLNSTLSLKTFMWSDNDLKKRLIRSIKSWQRKGNKLRNRGRILAMLTIKS
jgi:hypothetical protein